MATKKITKNIAKSNETLKNDKEDKIQQSRRQNRYQKDNKADKKCITRTHLDIKKD